LVILNKTDSRPVEALSVEQKQQIETMKIADNVTFLQTSCLTQVGIEAARDTACDLLLQQRVETKIAHHKDAQIASRIHVTNVVASRPACIPDSVLRKRLSGESAGEPMVTEKSKQEAQGGAGVYNTDMRREWMVKNPEWRYDAVPEIMDGMNVADFIDADIDKKLAELEAEEEALMWGDQDDEAEAKQWKEVQKTLSEVHSVMEQQKLENRLRRNLSRKAIVRRKTKVNVGDAESNLALMGVEVDSLAHRAKRKRTTDDEDVDMDQVKKRSTHRVFSSDISSLGATANPHVQAAAEIHKRKKTQRLAKLGKKGEADRFISVAKPKHLFSGKRGIGKTDRR